MSRGDTAIRKVTFFALALSLFGCGEGFRTGAPAPSTGEPSVGMPASGNGEGYLGPHTAGPAIPVRPDNRLNLGQIGTAAQTCMDDLLEELNAQIFPAAANRDRTSGKTGVRLEARGSGPSILRYESDWKIFSYFGVLSYPVALPAQEFRSVIAPWRLTLTRQVGEATDPVSELVLSGGLPQLLYQIDEGSDDAFDTFATAWIDHVEVRVPEIHGTAVPLAGKFEGAQINTVRYSECLISESSRIDQ